MSLHYFVDAYNLMYQCPHLSAAARHNLESARDDLIDRVARFCAASGNRAVIVFDGRGRDVDRETVIGGVEVIYAPHHLSADSIIERRVYESNQRSHTVIVSADRGIRDLCGGMGALTMRPAAFLAEMRDRVTRERVHLREAAEKSQRVNLEDRLPAESLERLHAIRRRLKS